jgi:hypothetical protein
VVLLDAYCINPEFVYGQYFLTAQQYQARYVHSIEGTDQDWHPFFNATWPLDDREGALLQDYAPDYLLADPPHAWLIDRKLRALGANAVPELNRDGYVLYRLSPPPNNPPAPAP